jgi:4-hydroxythreonine-4-phosphate dehydrogenase
MGDPAGIGPEIIIKALCQASLYEHSCPLVLGDVQVMTSTNEQLKKGMSVRHVEGPEVGYYRASTIEVMGLSDLDCNQLQPGRPTGATGRAMVKYVLAGADLAIKGRTDGLVTCPINKKAMHAAGYDFEGHTELLAHRTKTSDCVMMLAGSKLKVALVTIHVPLAQVSARLTTDRVLRTIHITEEALRKSFDISKPRLAVAALNPHSGEDGLFGKEEINVISPAVRQAAEAGIDVAGPYPADTLFHSALKGRWDAVIAMYHDQGLIPFKMVHFSEGVNTTLGLPIVRTSVDHGTAYDIAGTGKADPGSLVAAIRMAARQAVTRMRSRA